MRLAAASCGESDFSIGAPGGKAAEKCTPAKIWARRELSAIKKMARPDPALDGGQESAARISAHY
jgi:hypothetical protein